MYAILYDVNQGGDIISQAKYEYLYSKTKGNDTFFCYKYRSAAFGQEEIDEAFLLH